MKYILTLLITIFTLQFAVAQTNVDRVSSTEIISLVTDAVTKHNAIYNERVKDHETEQATLCKAIYDANTELMSIRALMANSPMFKSEHYAKLEKPLADLKTAIDAVKAITESEQCRTSDADLQKAVSNVCTKAKAVKKVLQKVK